MTTVLSELLHANEKYKQDLDDYATKLRAELDSLNKLMDAVEHSENDLEVSEDRWCLQAIGAFKPVGVIDVNETLREDSPFYADANRREQYISFTTTPNMFGDSERQCLQKAIIKENKRQAAFHAQQLGESAFEAAAADDNTFLENTEGIDWVAVARDVSVWSHVAGTRTAQECKVRWLGAQHPRINTQVWSIDETKRLNDLVEQKRTAENKLNWEEIATELQTNRSVLDCIRHYVTKVRSSKFTWTKEIDTKLLAAVEKNGTHNWIAVASAVSPELSPNQCQIRYDRTLNPSMRRGKFTNWEDQQLLSALEIYGTDWMRIAQKLPGRTNTQCRSRFISIMEANKARWSEYDDENLMEAIKKHGTNWTNVQEELGGSRPVEEYRKRFLFLTMSVKKPRDTDSNVRSTNAAVLQLTPTASQNQEQHAVNEAELSTSRKKFKVRPPRKISRKATTADQGVMAHSSNTTPARSRKRRVNNFLSGVPGSESDKDDETGSSTSVKKRTPKQTVLENKTQVSATSGQKNETHAASTAAFAAENNNRRMTTRSLTKRNKVSLTNQPD